MVNPDSTIRQQRVLVGRIIDDKVELRDGVTSEDRVVASGGGFLRDGDKVQLEKRVHRRRSPLCSGPL